ncbi:hypothetical protein V8E51_007112 [Hyaloscypha variabilis]
MESLAISTSSSGIIGKVGSTTSQADIPLPQNFSSNSPGQIYKGMPYQGTPNDLSEADNSRRAIKESRSRSKQIPFRRPPGYVQLGRHDQYSNKAPLTVHVPTFAEMNVSSKGGGSSKFRGTTINEILDLDASQPTSPESIEQAESDAACQSAHRETSISKHQPKEARFHFNDSFQVQAQDFPTINIPEYTQLVRDDPSIAITYDRVWDPFAPPSQRLELPKETATFQSYRSPVTMTRFMSFSLLSNYTEPNIHHAPLPLPSSSALATSEPPTPAWKIASQLIVKAPKGPELARLEDCVSEDIAIRAVLNGWDSIGEPWELPPFWRVIRVLDELIFGKFSPVVRLASLRVVHLLMRYHSDPPPERAKNMPKFYNLKGLDFDDDYSIGNFLPWPGIRALAQTPLASFRSDKFFRLKTTTLKILWPFSLQDCYTRDPSTGLFAISKGFDKRIYDINAWTFEPKMFEQFPELYGGGGEEEEVVFSEWG